MKNRIILVTYSLLIFSMAGQSQNIKDYLDAYIGENAKPYIQPLADIFTSNINTHVWEWSDFDSGFYARLKVQAMISFPSETMRTFTGKTTGDFRPEQTLTAPTVIGNRRSIILIGEDSMVYIFPGGYDLKRLMLGTPQLTFGGFLHSEVSVRFLAFPLEQDLGHVRVYGIGGRHAITGHFPDFPIDISLGYFYHHIRAGTYLDSDQHLITAHLGKSGKLLSTQFMIGYQTSGTDIQYTYEDEETVYDVDLFFNNKNPWIVEASAGVRLGPVFASGAVSYSGHINIAAGAGLFF